jgi:hypothetical protein
MPRLDLDAIRAENGAEPKIVRLGGVDYVLPSVLPLALAQYLAEAQTVDAIRCLFGEEHIHAVERLFSADDLAAVAATLYAVDAGKSVPAAESSRSNGAPSRPISAVSTA